MTQLIYNGMAMPYSSNDKYYCHEEFLGKELEMISGRIVTELRGKVWVVHYEYDHIGDTIWRAICPSLISREAVTCQALPDNGDTLISIKAKCTELTYPKFAFGRGGKAYWHNIAFTLREVSPHA